jgi:hypothetical protein
MKIMSAGMCDVRVVHDHGSKCADTAIVIRLMN